MTSACGSLQDANIGSVTGSATYDACDSDTISISANNVPSATADKQYSVQREVCGDGEVIVKVLSVSGGLAGLELRASNAPGAIKVGLRTALGTSVQRFVRTSTDGSQSSNNTSALGHKWLKLVRSGSSVSTYTSTNGSTWNFAASYTISLPTCVQASLLMQSVNVGTTHTGVFKDLQFSSFTLPAGDTTTVAFDQDTISANAGDTINICLSITNPCICSPTEVDVQLVGSNTPHFVGYQPENLTFEAEDTTLCFLLPVSNVQVNGYYKFVIEPYTDDTLTVLITGAGGDPGPVGLCGVEPNIYSLINSSPAIKATDRFGNFYPLEKLEVKSNCGCVNGSGIFELTFQDVCLDRDYGFDDDNEGPARQEVVCRMFRDLSVLLNPGDVLPEELVNIEIKSSKGQGIVQMEDEVIALASPLHLTGGFEDGITDGLVAKAIQSGVNPFIGLEILGFSEDSYHGYARFNFEDFTFHLNNDTWVSNPEGQKDLYTVALHEALHILGFYSLINPLSPDRFSTLEVYGAPRWYSRYDTYLRTLNGANITSNGTARYLKYPIPNNPYEVEVATTPSFPETPLCTSDVEIHGNACQNQALYRPDPWNSQGISHLNCDASGPGGCSSFNGYVMNTCTPDGFAQRYPNQKEVNLLCDLGYSLSGQFGTDTLSGADEWLLPYHQYSACSPPTCNAIGVNDDLSSISIESGETVTINIGPIIGNDINNTAFFIPNSFELIDINYPVGEVRDSSYYIIFHADDAYFGPVIMRYLPACVGPNNTRIPGQWAYVIFYVSPPEDIPCPENNNNCELICYGDFEDVPPGGLSSMYNFRIFITPSTDFMSFFPFTSEPWDNYAMCNAHPPIGGTLYPHENTFPNTKFAGFITSPDNAEGIQLKLIEPLQVGQLYELSYYLLSGCDNQMNFHFSKERACPTTGNPIPPQIRIDSLIFGDAPLVNCDGYVYERGQFVSVPFENTDSDGDTIPEWRKDTITFIADDSYEYVLIYQNLLASYIFMDNISLRAVPRREVTISSENLGSFCPGELSEIRYTICSDLPLEDITLVAQIPSLIVDYAEAGDFIDGETTIEELTQSGDQYCAQVVLSLLLTEGLSDSTEIPVHLNLPDACTKANEPDAVIVIDYQTDASFTYDESECASDFTSNSSSSGLTHLWTFGDFDPPLTSSEANPSGIPLPVGEHLVSHTVFNTCDSDTYSENIVVTSVPPDATFTLVSEACGLVTFSITGLFPGDAWEIGYGNGVTDSSLVHNYTLTPETYTATLTVTNNCGTIEIPLEVEIEGCPELDCCPNTSSMLLVNTLISDAIAAGLPPGGTSSDICIEGFLMVDEDYTFSGNLFLGPDARIVVTSEATLELDGAHLQGCDFLWRGIEVKQPHVSGAPSLISHNETRIEDAKRGVDAAYMVLLDIKETTFDRNFIGLYLNNVPISGFHGNTFDCTDVLKPSFSSAPNIGDYSYAGIQSQGGALHIGVAGTVVNTFQNLRNGIINLRGPMTVENSVFYNIEKAPDEPYDMTGYGIHHRGISVGSLDQRGLGYGTNATLTFDNCYTAIWADKCNIKARFNRMADVHTGIQAQYCKNDDINIDHNRIASYGIGISLLQNDPATSILVWENHLYVNENSPTNAAGVGIFVQESGSQQFNAIIQQNPIYLYRKDKGIFLNTTTGYTVRDNDVFLESAIVNDAMGIVMEKSALCRVSCNDIVGSGKGNGLVSNTTSATLYSCNTVENLSIGAAFDGASGSVNLRTTEFVPPLSKGLLYKENIAMMPAQSHRGNRWNTGTYSSAAAVHEGSGDFFYFFDQRFEIHTTSAPYYPPSISLTGADSSDWFVPTGNSPFSICNPTVECPVFGFAPDKDEVKSREEQLAGDEFAGEWPGGLHWAAQWQLYEMLERSPGIRDTSTVMDSYYTGKGTGALGRLHALQKDIDTLFQLLPEQQDTLRQYIEQTESLMEALALADSMAVHAPLSATPGLPQQLLAQCDSLLSLSEALVDEIFDARAAIIDTLFAQNTAIADTAIYIVNEKVVNEIYLSTLKQDSLALDTLQTDTLYAIATQCPETGGPAVYRARSLYALIAMVDFDTINCRSVASLQSPPQQALAQLPDKQANFHVFPNPNQGRFTVAYELEQDGTLVLTDILGRQAATASLLADARRKEVSASELKAGLYYLHILSGNGELLYSNRIIIIH